MTTLQALLAEARRRAPKRRRPAGPEATDAERARLAVLAFQARMDAQAGAMRALSQPGDAQGLWPGLARSAQGGGARPLRVLLAATGGPTLFETLEDPRIVVVEATDGEPAEPDLVVVPRAERIASAAAFAAALAPGLWRRIAQGAAGIVLDASSEGAPHRAARSDALHQVLREKAVDPRGIVYVTQDRGYGSDYEAHCARAGLTLMQVWVYDAYIRHTFQIDRREGERLFADGLARLAAVRRERRFVSLNFNPRPSKVLFLLRLLRDGLWDQGFISFAGFDWRQRAKSLSREAFVREMREQPGFGDAVEEVLPWLDALDAKGPLLLGDQPGSEPDTLDRFGSVELQEYRDAWFTVVTETEMSGRLHRITEKPFRPMLNFHPILVLGSPGALRLIRAYGFQTFDGLFDEAYDDEPDARRRFEMVYAQVSKLCRMDEAELAGRWEAVAERIVFNARWGLIELPNLFRARIDAELADRLVSLVRPAPASPA